MPNRRNALIGMGTVAVGAGIISGTGAFTQVEAERNVSVSTTDDTEALLAFEPLDTPDGNAYAAVTDDMVEIDISGINLNALTKLSRVFSVTNNGNGDVLFYITFDPGDGQDDWLPESVDQDNPATDLPFRFETDADGRVLNYPETGDANAFGIGDGESIDVNITVDTRGVDISTDEPLYDGEMRLSAINTEQALSS